MSGPIQVWTAETPVSDLLAFRSPRLWRFGVAHLQRELGREWDGSRWVTYRKAFCGAALHEPDAYDEIPAGIQPCRKCAEAIALARERSSQRRHPDPISFADRTSSFLTANKTAAEAAPKGAVQ